MLCSCLKKTKDGVIVGGGTGSVLAAGIAARASAEAQSPRMDLRAAPGSKVSPEGLHSREDRVRLRPSPKLGPSYSSGRAELSFGPGDHLCSQGNAREAFWESRTSGPAPPVLSPGQPWSRDKE